MKFADTVKNFKFTRQMGMIVGVVLVATIIGLFLIKKYIIDVKPASVYSENVEEDESNAAAAAAVKKGVVVYFFYTTWCPYSLSAIPEWQKLVSKYTKNKVNGYDIKFVDVDCTKETVEVEEYINKYNIEGYPTIKMIKDDQVIEFDAKAKFDNMEKFLHSVL